MQTFAIGGYKMKNLKIYPVIFILLCLMVITTACFKNNQTIPSQEPETNLTIYTTFYPLYDFTTKIVGQDAQVNNLVPAGVEPHDFELSPKQAAEIYNADVFIF